MSTRKIAPHKTPKPTAAEQLSADEVAKRLSIDFEDVEGTSLELDEQFDRDTDPYNRTGQYLVDALRRKNG